MQGNDTPSVAVICEDGPVLAVNKPAGVLTQGVPQGQESLEHLVRKYIKIKYEKPGNVYLGIPHRLDRPTSGVVVFARNSKAAARLAEQFADRSVRKEYLAVVTGYEIPERGEMVDLLLKDADRAYVSVVDPSVAGAKRAELEFEVLQRDGLQTLVLVRLKTGRMHQIRVQFASRGWPIIGDSQYDTGNRPESSESPQVIALHAWRLTLKHPIRYDSLTLEAPLPPHWIEARWVRGELPVNGAPLAGAV